MAVMVLGLVAAQGLSAWINLAERDRVMLRAAGAQPAQRLADLVLLLDPLEPSERERLVRVLDAPPLQVRLQAQARHLPLPPAGFLDAYPGAARHLAQFEAALREQLGEDRVLQVQLLPLPPGRGAENRRGPWARGEDEDMERRHRERMERMEQRAERAASAEDRRRARLVGAGLVFAAQVRLADGQWLRVDTGVPADPDLPLRLVSSLAVLLAAVLALSWWAVRRVTQPLRQLAEAAEGLGHDLSRPPLPTDGPQEVEQANRAFNTMQARLRRTLDERTRMLTAMSHDLKTPLTRMRLRAELLDDEALRERMTHDLDEMTQMVGDTLAFLRGLEQPQEHRPVDLDALLESLVADQQAMGRSVSLRGRAVAPWVGDAARLRRCVGNLVDNAVLYGQRADLQLQDGPTGLVLRVRDQGPGIPPESLEQVFEPFFRLEASRNRVSGGSGLGLGIARHIAETAGGSLRLRNHPEGGLEAELRLPRPAHR
ncbi:HAMP domain-containing protein [Ideonella sp. TBM-1]|uniref:histidine kinase n=2 Tax=Ideonella livida TaxID=2707176 RepID=A0A7C9PIJ8_9BURK|nr:HAMP domain-containing protein [Ideonella livida]